MMEKEGGGTRASLRNVSFPGPLARTGLVHRNPCPASDIRWTEREGGE